MNGITYIERSSGKVIKENPPGEKYLKFLYQSALGKLPLESLVKRKWFSAWYGKRMDSPRSAEKIKAFIRDYSIDMNEAIKSADDFHSFNDFFYRELKPEARPIGKGLVSPADGKLLAFNDISSVRSFFIKGEEFNLRAYLRNDRLAEEYANGAMIIVRLAPNDYHRYHFPASGVPSKTKEINGFYYSVSPYALANNFIKVFLENKRSYVTFQCIDGREVVISPVAATMVGSMHNTYQPGTPVEVGTEMGYFSFGGSTIVMLLKKDEYVIDEDLLKNTRNKLETSIKMGETIGQ